MFILTMEGFRPQRPHRLFRCLTHSHPLSRHLLPLPHLPPLLPQSPPHFIFSLSANPWAPASCCNPRPSIRASKPSSPNLPSPICVKLLMITPVCEHTLGSEKLCLRRLVGRCCIAETNSPVFPSRKFRR